MSHPSDSGFAAATDRTHSNKSALTMITLLFFMWGLLTSLNDGLLLVHHGLWCVFFPRTIG